VTKSNDEMTPNAKELESHFADASGKVGTRLEYVISLFIGMKTIPSGSVIVVEVDSRFPCATVSGAVGLAGIIGCLGSENTNSICHSETICGCLTFTCTCDPFVTTGGAVTRYDIRV